MSIINEDGMRQDELIQLNDREKARTSTSMYLGGTAELGVENSESARTAVREAYDNSKNELLKGNGNTIWVFVEEDKNPLNTDKYEGRSISKIKKWIRYTVADNASGIPIKAKEDLKHEVLTTAEIAVSNFGAGTNFHKDFTGISQHGTGVAACNFTSAEFIIYSHLKCHDIDQTTDYVKSLIEEKGITKRKREGWYYKLTFQLGYKVSEDVVYYENEPLLVNHFYDAKCYPSTVTSFILDPTIHGSTYAEINEKDFSYLGYLLPNSEFYINHNRIENMIGYEFSDSITINYPYTPEEGIPIENPRITFTYSFELSKDLFEYNRDFSINTLNCQQGKHVKVWDDCFTAAFCSYFDDWDIQKYSTWGVNVLVVFQANNLQFNSQTKEKCSGVPGWYMNVNEFQDLVKSITKIIKKNHDLFAQQYERIKEYHESKLHLGKMKELKKALGSMINGNRKSMSAYMPYKLIACTNSNAINKSVYLCEGDSAGSSLVKGRKGIDNVAVMPLKGKVKNIVGMNVNESLENQEISDITYICGGVDDFHLNVNNLPFDRYIICTDEDSDGKQIASLLLGVLLQNHLFLFGTSEKNYEDSKVFIAKAALYGFFDIDGVKGSKKLFFAGEENEVAKFQKSHKYKYAKRWKGLGECSPDEIASMYFNEKTARLLQVTPINYKEALNLIGYSEQKRELMIEKQIISSSILDLSNPNLIASA